ncbi:MAG: glycosyltransferase family 2 protein [Acidimicrobiales bacterium]
MHSVDLAVVIPTTHRVREVRRLVEDVRSSSPVPVLIFVVDNGPSANSRDWEGLPATVSVDSRYLGSEGSFLVGARLAAEAEPRWCLFLDHDATLAPQALPTLLRIAERDPDACYGASLGEKGENWDHRRSGKGDAHDMTAERIAICQTSWSGLLLNPAGLRRMIPLQCGYFFDWDDYYMCSMLAEAGVRMLGVPCVSVGNDRREGDYLSPWRAYYATRNYLLLLRDTHRIWSRELIAALSFDLKRIYGAAITKRPDRAMATLRGLGDGLLNRRGMRFSPHDRAAGSRT